MTKTPDETKKGLEWDEVDESLRKIRFDDAGEVVEWKPKTSTDTKNGLLCCTIEGGCNDCPYQQDCFQTDGFSELAGDALTLIRKLEDHLREATKKVEQLEAERDAAVEDLHYLVNHPQSAGPCYACKHTDECYSGGDCDPVENDRWEWRGVQKEEWT